VHWVDWYLDVADAHAVHSLRREIRAYLHRHAAPDADIGSAELVVAELLGNVVRHAAGRAWVSLTWGGTNPVLTIYDLGPGFEPDTSAPDDPLAEGGRGLLIVSNLVDRLAVASRRNRGAQVTAVLPVTRPETESHDPPRRRTDALPHLDEAVPGVGFRKEPFLRALVVQLAQTIEHHHGPSAAEAAVAQVGVDVGGQMEAEYRAAKEIAGRMSASELADCYVRLKHAIDGGFHVLEATPERIVLGNHRCPFGDAVQRAPALCRMTSSVFGGIAARNTDSGAAVVLEERIAVGDPGCRVVVHLDGGAADGIAAHRYATPTD
jgi:anti-sigma regulatory factor (Ser/Thr protein kinase)